MTTIAAKLQQVRARIATACRQAGRNVEDVTLLAVSKTFGPQAVRAAADAGQLDFGENYLQEGVDKIAALADLRGRLRWHCIGPIQSNKTQLVARHFHWAQTIDRAKIAQRLNDQRPQDLAPLNVCIQVNADGGPTKSGVSPEDAVALALFVAKLPRLRLRGVMSIPDPQPDFEAQCAAHRRVREVFDAIAARLPSGHGEFDTLSLGMTADLEAAIHAGSTMVRVGTGIFGSRARVGA